LAVKVRVPAQSLLRRSSWQQVPSQVSLLIPEIMNYELRIMNYV